jgi:hypothetical protein
MTSPRRLKARLDASRRYKTLKLGPLDPGALRLAGQEEEEKISAENYYQRIGFSHIKSYLGVNDVIITVEHCCCCDGHSGMSLRHDESKYYQMAHEALRVSY